MFCTLFKRLSVLPDFEGFEELSEGLITFAADLESDTDMTENGFMDEKRLIKNTTYLLSKYLHDRMDLAELIQQDPDSVKYILSKIDKEKQIEYDDADLALIKEISFHFL